MPDVTFGTFFLKASLLPNGKKIFNIYIQTNKVDLNIFSGV